MFMLQRMRLTHHLFTGLPTGFVVIATATRAHTMCDFQEGCRTDADCGHGFECVHGQGSDQAVYTGNCGDGACDNAETEAECPEDCTGYSHCRPASCEDDSQCAVRCRLPLSLTTG